MVHELKILNFFADCVYSGVMPFNIRNNDRHFVVGDLIRFKAIDSDCNFIKHPINECLFRVTYVLQDYHVEHGYVAIGIKPFIMPEREGFLV